MSTTTGSISSLGIGSGLDINSIISQMVAAEKTPLTALQSREAKTTAQISAVGSIKSLMDTLNTATQKLTSVTGWNTVAATSSNSDAVTATAIGGTQPTNFSVAVQQLAQARSTASQEFAANTYLGAGTLTISSGSTSTDITISGSDQLGDVASKINGANAGVSATILTDPGTGAQHLLLTGKTTGAANSFTVSVTDSDGNNTDGAGLSRLADQVVTTQSAAYTASTSVVGGSGTLVVNGQDITVSATDSLQDIADTINNTSGIGVTASITTDSSGAHLSLVNTSGDTGPAGAVTVTAGSGASPALALFATGMTTSSEGNWTDSTTAQDAQATINGIAVTSSSNTFNNVVAGVTLTVKQVTSSPSTVSVTQDVASMQQNIQDFVTAYNAVNDDLEQLTAYDASTQIGGVFQGDTTILTLQNTLRSALQSVTTANGTAYGVPSTLSDVGIEVQDAGDLSIDTDKMTAAFANPDQMKALFANLSTDSSKQGIAVTIQSVTSALLGSTGLIQTETDALNNQLTSIQSDEDDVNNQANNLQTQLTQKYSALDSTMATLNSTAAYLTQQIAQWNKN